MPIPGAEGVARKDVAHAGFRKRGPVHPKFDPQVEKSGEDVPVWVSSQMVDRLGGLGARKVFTEDLERGGAGAGQSQYMPAFFQQVGIVKQQVASIRLHVNGIRKLHHEFICGVNPSELVFQELTGKMGEMHAMVLEVRNLLKSMFSADNPDEGKHGLSRKARIRQNMQFTLAKKFMDLVVEFTSMDTKFTDMLRERLYWHTRTVKPDVTAAELNEVLEGDFQDIFARHLMAQNHKVQLAIIADLNEHPKTKELNKLSTDIPILIQSQQFFQLFVDMTTLLGSQGELINNIDYNVSLAQNYKFAWKLSKGFPSLAPGRNLFCWITDMKFIIISGATGPHAAAIGGPYIPIEAEEDGFTCYVKLFNGSETEGVLIKHGAGLWQVIHVLPDDDNDNQIPEICYASVQGGCALDKCTSRVWRVHDGMAWTDQPKVNMVLGDIEAFVKTPEGKIWLKKPFGKALWKGVQLIKDAPHEKLDLSDLLSMEFVLPVLDRISQEYPADSAVVTSMNMRNSCNDMQPHHAAELQSLLRKFPSLKHLDVSRNPGLKLIPISLLHVAAELETFNCIECPLRLPPQNFFSNSEDKSCIMQNARRIRESDSLQTYHKIVENVKTKAPEVSKWDTLRLVTFDDLTLDLSAANLVLGEHHEDAADIIKRSDSVDYVDAGVSTTSISSHEVQEYLVGFTSLWHLDLSRNPNLGNLGLATILTGVCSTKISTLNLSDTGFDANSDTTTLHQLLRNIRVLEHLDLSRNPNLGCLVAATILSSVPEGTATSWISTLKLSDTGLVNADATALHQQLRKFRALEYLDISRNSNIGCLGAATILMGAASPKITTLKLSDTGLANANSAALHQELRKCIALEHLDLSRNRGLDSEAVAVILQSLSGASKLKVIDLSDSGIETIPVEVILNVPNSKQLRLVLDGCQKLVSLPLSLHSLKAISAKDCPALLYPPKSALDTPESTMRFLIRIKTNSVMWKRIKVVFLGNGRSGKTSILRTLARMPLQPDELSTRGVTVDAFAEHLKPNFFDKLNYDRDLELSFWDFAGQLEYSAAHEFFLSSRQAVYVAVYSVLDDSESIMQQLLYWLSVIPDPTSNHVRLMIVGTKIDMVPADKLKAVLDDKRQIVRQVMEAKGLLGDSDMFFVSALETFEHSNLNMSWETCRRDLKTRIYENCIDIFDPRQKEQILFPKECRQLNGLVQKLKNELIGKQKRRLPCCKLDDDDACRILGSVLDEKWSFGSKQGTKDYFKSEIVRDALAVLHDLGTIVLYGDPQLQSICLRPQFLPGIISLLVDPKTVLAPVTTVQALMQLMEKNPDDSCISTSSTLDEKEQLLMLLESVGIVRRYGQKLLVPLALRGRPVCWSEMIRSRESVVLFGQRLGISLTITVPAACFLKVMLDKCSDAKRMWGCAFAFDVGAHGAGEEGSGCIFVRLREDRRSVDVVAVMHESQGIAEVVKSEFDTIASLLGKGFNSPSDRMQLCPMCCSSDMFVRSGAVHAFHMQEVSGGGVLQCSRYHDVTVADVVRGKLTMLDMDALPLVYPSRMHELQLPWKQVTEGGIINNRAVANKLADALPVPMPTAQTAPSEVLPLRQLQPGDAAWEPDSSRVSCPGPSCGKRFNLFNRRHHCRFCGLVMCDGCASLQDRVGSYTNVRCCAACLRCSERSLDFGGSIISSISVEPNATISDELNAASLVFDDAFRDGMFTDISFFVLTGQVSAGDTIAAADLPEFVRFLSMCSSQDCICDITLSSGERKTLHFSFQVGQPIMNSFCEGLPIHFIFPADVGDTAQQAPQLQRFCAHDNVLVVFGPLVSKPKPKFLVFPGSSVKLQLCRLTPAYCRQDLGAACCWSELQDQFSVVMGNEFEMYEITALTLMRNDVRAKKFTYNVHLLEERAPKLPSTPHWCKTPRDVAACLGPKLDGFRAGIERAGIDGTRLAAMSDSELRDVAASLDGGQFKEELLSQLQWVKEVCEAQVATMRHFDEYTAKFSVRPPHKNVDVNVTVAWWGNSRGNAVYLPVAQNGFVNLPSQLKIDEGYYGSGFYFTRYPRYSDYYISGCKQFAKAGDDSACFLMSFVACGRPFPVTQQPGPTVNRTPLEGKPCNQQSPCCGGAGRHDSHYVCVKFNGQYFPCPPREQPDYDEIITFNSDVVLPVAAFEFKRRRRTLLWLDDNPQNNYTMLRTFPGCPLQPAALHCYTYPMQQHCSTCGHGLTMDANPRGTNFFGLKERQKAVDEAKKERDNVQAAARTGSLDAQARLQSCNDVLRLAESALASAAASAAAVVGEFAGRDITMEEQTDVVLFTNVRTMTHFLLAHPELSKYPPSLLRIVSNYKLLHEGGLLDFFDTDSAWRYKYPATLMFYQYAAADKSRVHGRPNFFSSTQKQALEVFTTFKSFALLPLGCSSSTR
jgi:GTPase SAR1 family protein/t-SNARE complex subunit (syntaxin)